MSGGGDSEAKARAFIGIDLEGERGGRRLFSNLSFSLAPGAALVLSGPNGSGKSSLLRLMAGFGRPAKGSLRWDTRDIHDDIDAFRGQLHLVGYQDGIKPALTAAETLRFWIALGGGKGRCQPALDALGIGHLAETSCRLLSSGQKRRLSLARLVASPRPLWLLDEPAVGLDADALAGLSRLIDSHLAAGGAAVIATHQEIALSQAQHLSLADFLPRRTLDADLAGAW